MIKKNKDKRRYIILVDNRVINIFKSKVDIRKMDSFIKILKLINYINHIKKDFQEAQSKFKIG